MAIRTPILAQLRARAIVPACQALGLDSPAARNLLLGTAAQETGGRFIAQYPAGPALSVFQIEPATARDAMLRVGARRPQATAALQSLRIPSIDWIDQLAVNAVYAAAVARVIYWLVEEALPAAHDVAGFGAYWKANWNTPAGAGNAEEFARNFHDLIGDPPDLAPPAGEV